MAVEDVIEAQERAKHGLGTVIVPGHVRDVAHRSIGGRGTVVLLSPGRARTLRVSPGVSRPMASDTTSKAI